MKLFGRLKRLLAMKSSRLLDRVEEEARGRRISKSKVIRGCLEERLFRSRRGKKLSCHELARRLAGSLRGPRDLATNPKYLESLAIAGLIS